MKVDMKLTIIGLLALGAAACSYACSAEVAMTETGKVSQAEGLLPCADPSDMTGTYTVAYTAVGSAPVMFTEDVVYIGGERRDLGAPCDVVSGPGCKLTEAFRCGSDSTLTTMGFADPQSDAGPTATLITGTVTFPMGTYTFRGTLKP